MTTEQIAEVRVDLRGRLSHWCETLATVLLFGFALAAPHSIAGSQGGFLAAAVFWLAGRILDGRLGLRRTALDWPLLGLFIWATLSACFSYEPYVSLRGLRGLAFFSTFYLITTRACEGLLARRLAIVLILSCLVNVTYTIYQKAVGQGLHIDRMTEQNRLSYIGIQPGDVLISADGRPLTSLTMLSQLVDAGPPNSMIKLAIRRGEIPLLVELPRRRIQKIKNLTGADRFGVEVSRARDFRAQGFYNHYATYAEVLQLIASLAVGLLLTSPKRIPLLAALTLAAAALISALIFTATRAPLLGLALSVVLMALTRKGIRRTAVIALILIALPVGVYLIAKWRGIGLIDTQEGSTAWRLQVWQEGIKLSLKHPIFGIGKG
ncbi:MAG: O-antigen ligase family protein, partial [Acidobacteriota bacterium]